MIEGIYQNAASMSGLESWNNAIAQNLAQSSAPGYKKAMLTFEGKANGTLAFDGVLEGQVKTRESITAAAKGAIDHTAGQISVTGEQFDFAIEGPGFFELMNPVTQEMVYTRDGQFKVNEEGQLVSKQGYQVLTDDRKDIMISGGVGGISVGTDGVIRQQGGAQATIGVKAIDEMGDLVRAHGGFIIGHGSNAQAKEVPDRVVRHGALELSNVSGTHEMINMIKASRAFAVNQKVIQNYDQLLGQAITKLGG